MITTDASEYALGAVLSQEGEKGDRPIAYASRRLTEAET
ncbi:RNase H-like domain-containing protein, partial [Klebsiella pneumoniae]